MGNNSSKNLEIERTVCNAKEGNKAAIDTLTMTFRPLILSAIKNYLDQLEDFDDSYQEGIIVILTAIKTYSPNSKMGFCAYVKDQMHFYFMQRKNGRYTPAFADAKSLDKMISEGFEPVDVNDDIKEAVEDLRLYTALLTLNDNQRNALVEFFFHGKSQREIADKEGVSVMAITMRISRAISNLRNRLS